MQSKVYVDGTSDGALPASALWATAITTSQNKLATHRRGGTAQPYASTAGTAQHRLSVWRTANINITIGKS